MDTTEWKSVEGFIPEGQLSVQFGDDLNGRKIITGIMIENCSITATVLRNIPVTLIENKINLGGLAAEIDVKPLKRAGVTPEEFSRQVAEQYTLFATRSSRPVKLMADLAHVSLPTAHGWIREARLRGVLPPGKRYRAG